ncbi:Exocyst complex component 8 [Pseudolycoriella hygida]|uniref:Exocyst complex component 8 n=1 Tax=Pseudolycoriella hygida TaxID=35572 RepID=A0A9Q0MR42_9DIPT|nr:Exocyst complex component 8 [Pseudolycoriella hygida]
MSVDRKMTDPNLNAFDTKNFKCDDYVKDLVQECVGGSELQQRKLKIQNFSDQTSTQLKKHVYANYMQFIETAKEISHLESEMYQLSHLLIEQRNILATLKEESLNDQKNIMGNEDEAVNEQEQNKKAIETLKNSMQNYTDSLEDKTLLHEGGLIELDPDSYRPFCRVYLFLLNDLLIIAKYHSSKIAVINIRDLDGVKNAINVITPDGAKIFQCISPSTKTEWIEKFEMCIKFQQIKPKKGPAPRPPIQLQQQKSMIDTKSIASDLTMSPDTQSMKINWGPDWLLMAPEEILVLIAQRHFEDSLAMISKCEEYFTRDSTFHNSGEIIDKIKQLKLNLSNVLLLELSNCQSRSLHAALRSSRRPLKLLAEMGKAREACGTLLKVCSAAIRTSQRQARRNNLAISELFFCDLAQVSSEFLNAFKSKGACISTLVVWCNIELQYFASQLIKHYLTKGTQLEAVAKCVEGVRKPCAQLTEIGLDLSYHMEGLLRNSVEQLIEESRIRLVETMQCRSEDMWQPYNLQTKSHLKTLLRELDAVGIDLQSQVTGDTWINLTQTTVNFCRHFLSVTESCGYLAKNETLKMNVEVLLRDMFLAQYECKPSGAVTVDPNFVTRNKSYLGSVLLPIAIKKFEATCNGRSEMLSELEKQLRGPPKPKPRNVYKTDDRKMTDPNLNAFDTKNFKCDDYVKDLVQECVGGSELQQRKLKIQNFSDQTSTQLKKHVYANYMQFIETAKEISHLESEMYQLSHLLIEQRNILATLKEESLNDQKNIMGNEDEAVNEQEQNKKAIETLKNSMQNYTDSLEDKTLLHEGGLIELDPDSYRPFCRVYLFLLNDLLIIAKYHSSKIAVINIRDLDGVKNAINVITPDGAKIFQCISPSTKTEWIEKFEMCIKFQQIKPKKGPAPRPPIQLQQQKSMIDTKSIASDLTMSPDTQSMKINWGPDWLLMAPEEILVLIAQRHFEDSLAMISKCEEYFTRDSTFHNSGEIIDKIKQLKLNLSNVLLLELSNCQSRSLHAALRSSRRPLKLLAEMGKAREACGTLLKVCSAAIRTSQRQARRNNLAISELFFCDLAQVSSEFLNAFKSKGACISTLVVWCNIELQYFASQLIKHYLTKGTQLEAVAKCVEGVRKPCAQLTEIGLDLSYHMEGLLRNSVEQLIEESRIRLVETMQCRSEDMWQPYNLQTKSHLKTLLRELDAVGIDLQSQVTGDTWINLTQTTVNFCRHFLSVTESCGYLAKNETLKMNVEVLLRDMFLAQYECKPSGAVTVDPNFVTRNKSYLGSVLLPIAIKKFEATCNGRSEMLSELEKQLRGPPKPKPRNVYKTDVI